MARRKNTTRKVLFLCVFALAVFGGWSLWKGHGKKWFFKGKAQVEKVTKAVKKSLK